jgi:hypothetical protein
MRHNALAGVSHPRLVTNDDAPPSEPTTMLSFPVPLDHPVEVPAYFRVDQSYVDGSHRRCSADLIVRAMAYLNLPFAAMARACCIGATDAVARNRLEAVVSGRRYPDADIAHAVFVRVAKETARRYGHVPTNRTLFLSAADAACVHLEVRRTPQHARKLHAAACLIFSRAMECSESWVAVSARLGDPVIADSWTADKYAEIYPRAAVRG